MQHYQSSNRGQRGEVVSFAPVGFAPAAMTSTIDQKGVPSLEAVVGVVKGGQLRSRARFSLPPFRPAIGPTSVPSCVVLCSLKITEGTQTRLFGERINQLTFLSHSFIAPFLRQGQTHGHVDMSCTKYKPLPA